MIVVKVEMWPGGDELRAKEFARMIVSNQMKTTLESKGELGDYAVELRGGVYGRPDLYGKVWKKVKITGFNRKAKGLWDLLFVGLLAAVGDRNRPFYGHEKAAKAK